VDHLNITLLAIGHCSARNHQKQLKREATHRLLNLPIPRGDFKANEVDQPLMDG
jgi:hypothetical protein